MSCIVDSNISRKMSAWTLLKVKAGRNLKDVSPLGPTFTPEKSNKQKALMKYGVRKMGSLMWTVC